MHGVGGPNWRLLQRHGSLPRQLDDILSVNPDRRPRGAGADAGRAAFQTRADVAFHRGLRGLDRFSAHQTLKDAGLGSLFGHLDDAVRTVLLAVAAPDAGLVNEDVAVGKAMDC